MSNSDYWLADHLIVEDFDLGNLNEIHKPKMIEKFINDKIKNSAVTTGYNTSYDDPDYNEIVGNKFYNIIKDLFKVSEKTNTIHTWIYAQNKHHWNSVWHDHVTTSTINAVFYIDPPINGGGLELMRYGEPTTINPVPNKIYIFPYWMAHRPLPQEDDAWRISVNVEYKCNMRPIVRSNGAMW